MHEPINDCVHYVTTVSDEILKRTEKVESIQKELLIKFKDFATLSHSNSHPKKLVKKKNELHIELDNVLRWVFNKKKYLESNNRSHSQPQSQPQFQTNIHLKSNHVIHDGSDQINIRSTIANNDLIPNFGNDQIEHFDKNRMNLDQVDFNSLGNEDEENKDAKAYEEENIDLDWEWDWSLFLHSDLWNNWDSNAISYPKISVSSLDYEKLISEKISSIMAPFHEFTWHRFEKDLSKCVHATQIINNSMEEVEEYEALSINDQQTQKDNLENSNQMKQNNINFVNCDELEDSSKYHDNDSNFIESWSSYKIPIIKLLPDRKKLLDLLKEENDLEEEMRDIDMRDLDTKDMDLMIQNDDEMDDINERNEYGNEVEIDLNSIGINLDELMADFDPSILHEKESLVYINPHLEKIDNLDSKKLIDFDNHCPFFSFSSKIQLPIKKNITSKSFKPFKEKKNIQDNLLPSISNTTNTNGYIHHKSKNNLIIQQNTENCKSIMEEMISSKNFEMSFLFPGYSLELVRDKLYLNSRINAGFSDYTSGYNAYHHNNGYSDDRMQLEINTTIMSLDDEDSLDKSIFDKNNSPTATDHTSPYYTNSLHIEHTENSMNDYPRKRRRIERISSLLEKARNGSQQHSIPVSILKPLIDRYIKDRVTGQKNVVIRFSSLFKYLQKEIGQSSITMAIHKMHSDIFFRRIIVTMLFSVNEFNLNSTNGNILIQKEIGDEFITIRYNELD